MLRDNGHGTLRQYWKSIAFWAIVALVAWWLVCTSESFQSCIRERDNDQTYNALYKSPSIIRRAIIRLDINRACVGNFADKNQGSLTVFATFIIALFTFSLWRSTDKLWKAAKDQIIAAENAAKIQSADMNASIAVAKKSADAAAMGVLAANFPFIVISPPELSEATEFEATPHIHFGYRNSGKGIAIVTKITATVQTTPRGGGTLTLANSWSVNDAIEPGQPKSGLRITSTLLGVHELRQVKLGETMLSITFEIVSQDIFRNPYPQAFAFGFDHKNGLFTGSSLIPKEE